MDADALGLTLMPDDSALYKVIFDVSKVIVTMLIPNDGSEIWSV